MTDMSTSACRRYRVRGRVQGVFFRASTREQARQLELCGWARNLADGDVEVVARGQRDKLEQLAQWLAHGPPAANVTNVSSEALELETPDDFEIR